MDNKFEYQYFDSFRHGLVSSKLWLCEELEKVLNHNKKYHLHVLASWTNLITFMLLIRNSNFYRLVDAYDSNQSANNIANCITETWIFDEPKVYTHLADISELDYQSHPEDRIYINCSVEHLESRVWFDKIKKDSIIAIQSTNVGEVSEPWFIKDPVTSIEELSNRYKMNLLFSGEKIVNYGHMNYKRFMLIGIK